ncbi:hypothetical protein Sant_1904 [Sodalis praecaptivus]|uniref:Queuosine precursor transporter n=1 Tax=Sodalis praecaptivus TaxID=1239307 RepID=W0HT19_9GAMM|nr:queuosine precursor transporter [Sodalis praecaptivus]AHF76956.1 hypothetical protein Sant_1904 [Sodalis praecaptivus]
MILEKITNNNISYRVKKGGHIFRDSADSLVRNHLIDFFSAHDRHTILVSCSLSPLDLNRYKEFTIFIVLLTLFVSSLLIAIPLSPNTISVFSGLQPGGILIFPLSFAFLDTINEIFGRKHARNTVLICACALLLAAGGIWLSLQLPGENPEQTKHYQATFSPLPWLFFINFICLLTADNANNYIYSRFKELCNGHYLVFRCLVSTLIGQFLYSLIWILMFFTTRMPLGDMLHYVLSNYLFKVVYSLLVCIPITFILVSGIRRELFK